MDENNRVEIKRISREQLHNNFGSYFIACLLSALLGIVAFAIASNISIIFDGTWNSFVLILVISLLLVLAIYFYLYPLIEYGLIVMLRNIKNGVFQFSDLLSGFKANQGRIVGVNAVKTICIFVGTLLMTVPGIYMSLAYQFTTYILIEHPELTIDEVLEMSSEMTKGYKFDLLLYGLSWFGWISVIVFTCGFGMAYVIPYMNIANLNVYEYFRDRINNESVSSDE